MRTCMSVTQRSLTLSASRSGLKQLWFSELAKLPPPPPRVGGGATNPPHTSEGILQQAVTLVVTPAMLNGLVREEGAWQQLWAWLPEWSQIKYPKMVFRATSNGYKSVTSRAAAKTVPALTAVPPPPFPCMQPQLPLPQSRRQVPPYSACEELEG